MKNKDLREEIIDYLETEAVLMPASYIEAHEVERMSEEELLKLAEKLGINE